MKSQCPVCKSPSIEPLYDLEVPVLQNRVYSSICDAKESSKGKMQLTYCNYCQFVFNSDFEEELIVYDENYDNSIPTKLFDEYYDRICDYLYKEYHLAGGYVYDIGCGKGNLLMMLCKKYPDVTGIGVDPSYEGILKPIANLTFHKEFFSPQHVNQKPNLIISRHVLEHIEYPRTFISSLIESVDKFIDVYFFIEVPDFQWIVNNKTYWDICYEHTNYFTGNSLLVLFESLKCQINKITHAFDQQYLWVEGKFNSSISKTAHERYVDLELQNVKSFISEIHKLKSIITTAIQSYKNKGYKICVWGMSTKGVLFSNLIDPYNKLVDHYVDINTNKQNRHVPLTGAKIKDPKAIFDNSHGYLILVMNPNYAKEIKDMVSEILSDVILIDGHNNMI